MDASTLTAHADALVRASPDQVYEAWIDPQRVVRWMFPPTEPVVHARNVPDLHGQFSYAIRRGDQVIDHLGTYRLLERPGRLAFTWGVGAHAQEMALVTVTITPEAGQGCRCAVDHLLLPAWAGAADRCAQSWARMLQRLASSLDAPAGG
jgi:uncharacterized protein YndB with AHSA1/START domain